MGFRNSQQLMPAKYLSLLYSISERPLEYWGKRLSRSGSIRKVVDVDLLENVIEIQDLEPPNASNTAIQCPRDPSELLHIELPVLVIIVKNMDVQFRLQIQLIDTQDCTHRFLFTNGEFVKLANPSRAIYSRIKLSLEPSWNLLELNFLDLTRNAVNRTYKAVQRLEISANCRIRKIYFADKHYKANEIGRTLCDGFLDTYMLKWGITSVENSMQTDTKKSKNRQVQNIEDNSFNSNQKNEISCIENYDFLKHLQTKINQRVENFIAKQPIKFLDAREIKKYVKMKSYVVPRVNLKQVQTCDVLSKDIFNMSNISRRFTDLNIPSKNKCIEHSNVNRRKRQEGSLDLRSMLHRKPKSAFLVNKNQNQNAEDSDNVAKE